MGRGLIQGHTGNSTRSMLELNADDSELNVPTGTDCTDRVDVLTPP